MPERADAHVHFFRQGFQESFTARPGVNIDELACFESLAADYQVTAALVVGYAAEDWCRDNNQLLAEKLGQREWMHAVAFVAEPDKLTVDALEAWRLQGFVGISIYMCDEQQACLLEQAPDEVWTWLVANRWLISVNSQGLCWQAWLPILSKHETLRVLISHMGLPPVVSEAPDQNFVLQALAGPLAMAKYSGTRVKLSAFYAITDPGHDFPHQAAWPYVECLRTAFGAERMLWASDYPPCLDSLSYPQTLTMFRKMPFFSESDCKKIEGGNLHALLAEVSRP